MEEIAQVAVQQYVLYQEGESQPRQELLVRLDAWSTLHKLIRSRICAVSRGSTGPVDELDGILNELFSPSEDFARQSSLEQLRTALAACERSTSCPLGAKGAD
jgi:hypothetical protein